MRHVNYRGFRSELLKQAVRILTPISSCIKIGGISRERLLCFESTLAASHHIGVALLQTLASNTSLSVEPIRPEATITTKNLCTLVSSLELLIW